MDQIKQGSKTSLDLFQVSLAKKYWPNKGLDSPTSGPSTNDTSYASTLTKNCRFRIKMTPHTKIEKMKSNPQLLEKKIFTKRSRVP